MRAFFIATLTVSVSVIVIACSGSNTPVAAAVDDAGSSGTSGSSGASDGSADADASLTSKGTCTTLTQEGKKIDIIAAAPPIPEARGGAPVDGKYILTGVTAFTGFFTAGSTIKTFGSYTIQIGGAGKTFEQVVTNGKDVVTSAKGDLVIENVTAFTATPTCEEPTTDAGFTILSGKFTAEPTTLKMYVVRELGITAELTFSKQ